MANTVPGIHLGIDTHANRPAANTVPDGSLYSCSTHALIYKSNYAGNSWASWATLGSTPSGSITASGYTQNTARLLGRTTAGSGAIEEITVGSGLSLSAGSLTASSGFTPTADRDLITNASPLTTTSTTFVDVTGASVTITTGAHRALVVATVACSHNTDTALIYLDVDLDGSRLSGVADGLVQYTQAGTRTGHMTIAHITDTLSAASHTFKLQWRTNFAGIATLYRTGTPIHLAVVELGV